MQAGYMNNSAGAIATLVDLCADIRRQRALGKRLQALRLRSMMSPKRSSIREAGSAGLLSAIAQVAISYPSGGDGVIRQCLGAEVAGVVIHAPRASDVWASMRS